MRQILQNLGSGVTELAQVPKPDVMSNKVLIATRRTLISAGTERMLVEFGRGSLVSKAKQQPDRVKQVLEKMRTDGVLATVDAVRSKLDQPLPLGYCNVGVVSEIGSGITEFKPGDRVASNGPHADFVSVSPKLCAKIPDGVSDEDASFTVLGAIALQGIRLSNPTLGECVAVTGLGLIGLIAVQLLRAQGCRVLGIDPDPTRVALAKTFGAETVCLSRGEDPLAAAAAFSRGRGMDAVLITASTQSNEPVHQAALMCRKRGRIVLVGVVGLELSRADFYDKELTFQVSCSYGPGRHDPDYEEKDQDYPIGFVRWTEQRNFEAVLDLMHSGVLDLEPLISHRFEIEKGAEAIALLTSDEPSLGILLTYPQNKDEGVRRITLNNSVFTRGQGTVAFLGAGNYASRVLIPAFKAAGAKLHTVVSGGGVSAVHFGKKFGFSYAATELEAVIENSEIDTVVVATRHDAHAGQVLSALRAGKHVFCEKPLCLTLDELADIEAEVEMRPEQQLMVGFNRRFAPQVVKMKALLAPIDAPKCIIITVNAGEIAANHWTQDIATGGGRIIGEACHFIDLARHLAGCPITSQYAIALGRHSSVPVSDDKVSLTLQFEDGSVATILYLANGNKGFPKERVEVFAAGRVLQLDNFRKLRGWGWPGFAKMNLWRQDKGQSACAASFLRSLKRGELSIITKQELIEVTRCTIRAAEQSRASLASQ